MVVVVEGTKLAHGEGRSFVLVQRRSTVVFVFVAAASSRSSGGRIAALLYFELAHYLFLALFFFEFRLVKDGDFFSPSSSGRQLVRLG